MKKNILFLSVIFSFFTLAGCSYTTSGSTLASHLKTIHVELFKNSINFEAEGRRNIYLPLLEVDTRNAVIDRYLFDGNLRVAESDEADLILRGQLIRYYRSGLRFTDNDDVEEYRVHVVVSIELYDTRNDEVLWKESSFSGDAEYFLTGVNVSTEESAVVEAIEDLARRIVERTIEDW